MEARTVPGMITNKDLKLFQSGFSVSETESEGLEQVLLH